MDSAKIEKNSDTSKENNKISLLSEEIEKFMNEAPPEEEEAKEVGRLLKALRPELRKVVEDIATGTQCRPEIPLVYMLGIASIALGYKVSNKFRTFENHPNVNIVVVARSGEGKSYPLELIKKPLAEAQSAELEMYVRARDAAAPEEKGKIHRRKFFTGDTTIEALKRDLINNPNGVGVIKDEGVLNSLGAYKDTGGQRKDDGDFLELFGCNGLEVNRKGDKDDIMSTLHSYSTWVGGTQPVQLPNMFGEERILSGMLARFLFVWPSPKERDETIDDTASDFSAWRTAVANMIHLPAVELATSPDAKEVFKDFRVQQEHARAAADDYEATWYAKASTYVFRVAIILHYLGEHYQSAILTADDARHAVAFMEYFGRQWMKVYEYIKKGAQTKENLPEVGARFYRLYSEKIKQEGGQPAFSQNDLASIIGVSRGQFSKLVHGLKGG